MAKIGKTFLRSYVIGSQKPPQNCQTCPSRNEIWVMDMMVADEPSRILGNLVQAHLLADEPDERWPCLASCQLHTLRGGQRRDGGRNLMVNQTWCEFTHFQPLRSVDHGIIERKTRPIPGDSVRR